MRIGRLVWIAAAALGLLVPVAGLAADTHQGKVVEAEKNRLTMTDMEGQEQHKHDLNDDVRVTIDGEEAKAEDLQEGDQVTVTTETSDNETKVTSIEAKRQQEGSRARSGQSQRRERAERREGAERRTLRGDQDRRSRQARDADGQRRQRSGQSDEQAALGVLIAETDEGARVVEVLSGSPAEEAGLREGDIILEVDGRQVDSARQLASVIAEHDPESTVKLEIERGGERQSLEADLEARRETFDQGRRLEERFGRVFGRQFGGADADGEVLEQLGELRRQMRTLLREVEQLRADVSELRSERQGRFSSDSQRESRGERFESRGRVGGRIGGEEDGVDQGRRSSRSRLDGQREQSDRQDY